VIKITNSMEATRIPDGVHRQIILKDIVDYWDNDPEHPWNSEYDGYLVYFEEQDKDLMFQDMPQIGLQQRYGGIYHRWLGEISGPMWEGVTLHTDEFYVVTVLFNNEFSVVYYIPNKDWVNADLINKLEERLDPPNAY